LRNPISINKNVGALVHSCCPSYAGRVNRKIMVHAGLGIIQEMVFKKITKTERAGSMA
jgi:hypothetical protein